MDPFGGLTAVASLANSFIQGKREEKIAKEQIKLAKQALKLQDIESSSRIALERALAMGEQSQRQRNSQVYALYGVGAAAAIISIILIAKAKKSNG